MECIKKHPWFRTLWRVQLTHENAMIICVRIDLGYLSAGTSNMWLSSFTTHKP